ncbi:SAM-dependent methyltransferase [Parapedobacter sp. DT-150]|uniref:SAM-dependent methyltransferase n=1 Tax=Parapedobacter sp. DT-150 TaxID=3396162 RepID=UPI003F1B7C51
MHCSILRNTGDAGFITVKALKRIQSADVIWMDEHVDSDVLRHIGEHCSVARSLDEVLRYLQHEAAHPGIRLARLTEERDSSPERERFELMLFSAMGFAVEIVPGISNVIRVSGASTFPLTVRGRNESFWVWRGTAAQTGDPATLTAWEDVAATQATLIAVNPPTGDMPRLLRAVAARRHAHTPVLYSSRDGQETILHLAQLATMQVDWQSCHLLVVNPSPKTLPKSAHMGVSHPLSLEVGYAAG